MGRAASAALVLCCLGHLLGGCSYSFTYLNDRHIDECETSEIMEEVREAYARDDFEESVHLATYIHEYRPDSFELEEALFVAGEASMRLEEYWDAFEFYKDLFIRFRSSQYMATVADRFYEIGEAILDQAPGVFGHLFTHRGRGVKVMTYLVTHYSRYSLADDAQMAVADYYFEDEEFIDAALFYKELIKEYPRSEWVEKAIFRLGMSYLKDSKGPSQDRETLLQAFAAMNSYINRYPKGIYIDEAQRAWRSITEQLAQKEMEIALFYHKLGHDLGTRIHLSNAVLLFPQTQNGIKAKALLDQYGWDTEMNALDRFKTKDSMSFLSW